MSTIEIGELKQQIADLEKKVRNLEWEKVRLKAGHEAISQVRCKAIVDSEKDTERLDWLIDNQINYATNEYGTIRFDQFDKIDRAEIDRARKEAKP